MTAPPASPYPGLRPFSTEDAPYFFGRNEQIDALLARLSSQNFVAVVGSSGCGKSSLIRAGLIPELKAGMLAGGGDFWRIVELRPGLHPISSLARALVREDALGRELGDRPDSERLLAARLRTDDHSLQAVVSEAKLPKGTSVLVFVDQFEELFTLRGEESNRDEGARLARLLLNGSRERVGRLFFLITMRAEYVGASSLVPGLPELLTKSLFLVPRLTREQCKEAIERPPQQCGGTLDPALVNRLLNEFGSDPDQLPLLQHALMYMWQRCTSTPKKLTVQDFQPASLSKILNGHAKSVYASALKSKNEQRIAEVMFRRLSQVRQGEPDAGVAARVKAIAALADTEPSRVIEVVEAFRQPGRSFLTPLPPTPLSEDTPIQVSHECLIRQWDDLRVWAMDEAKQGQQYEQLRLYARRWRDAGKPNGSLLRNPQLAQDDAWWKARKPSSLWAERYRDQQSDDDDFTAVVEYLKTSRKESAKRFWLWVTVPAVLALCVVVWAGWYGYELRGRLSERLAYVSLLGSREDPGEGLRSAVAAAEYRRTALSSYALRRALSASGPWRLPSKPAEAGNGVGSAVSPDGRSFLIVEKGGGLFLGGPENESRPLPICKGFRPTGNEGASVQPIAGFSQNGKWLAVLAPNGAACMYDTGDASQAAAIDAAADIPQGPAPASDAMRLALSDDGSTLALISGLKNLRVFKRDLDCPGGACPLPFRPADATASGSGEGLPEVKNIWMSPNGGRLLVLGADDAAHLWSVAGSDRESRMLHRMGETRKGVWSADFTADSKLLVLTDETGLVSVWDVENRPACKMVIGSERPCAAAFAAHIPFGMRRPDVLALFLDDQRAPKVLVGSPAQNASELAMRIVELSRQGGILVSQLNAQPLALIRDRARERILGLLADGNLRIWRAQDGLEVGEVPGLGPIARSLKLALAGDDLTALAPDGHVFKIKLTALAWGPRMTSVPSHIEFGELPKDFGIAIGGDGSRAIAVVEARSIHVKGTGPNCAIEPRGPDLKYTAVSSGRRLLAASSGGSKKLVFVNLDTCRDEAFVLPDVRGTPEVLAVDDEGTRAVVWDRVAGSLHHSLYYLSRLRGHDLWIVGELPPSVSPRGAIISSKGDAVVALPRSLMVYESEGSGWSSIDVSSELDSQDDIAALGYFDRTPEERRIAFGTTLGKVVVMDLVRKQAVLAEEVPTLRHRRPVSRLVFSADGNALVATYNGGSSSAGDGIAVFQADGPNSLQYRLLIKEELRTRIMGDPVAMGAGAPPLKILLPILSSSMVRGASVGRVIQVQCDEACFAGDSLLKAAKERLSVLEMQGSVAR